MNPLPRVLRVNNSLTYNNLLLIVNSICFFLSSVFFTYILSTYLTGFRNIIVYRNIRYGRKERIGLSRYCKRSDDVSFMLCTYDNVLSDQFIYLIFMQCCLNRFVFKIKMPSDVRVQLINDIADIEYGLMPSFCFLFPVFLTTIARYYIGSFSFNMIFIAVFRIRELPSSVTYCIGTY